MTLPALVLAILAALSLVLLLWQWLEAARFPLHRRGPAADPAPGLTLLKPLKGADHETATCLRSWLAQEYAGPVQVLFGIADPADPAAAVVRQLQSEFPAADLELVVCPERRGPNSKVSKLAQLEPRAKHALLVVSDADVEVPPGFLGQLATAFREAEVGLVTPFYQLATPATAAMHAEALAVNADFWSSVLQAVRLGPMRFALGAVIGVRGAALAAIGGFAALVDYLADDYELGRRVTGVHSPSGPDSAAKPSRSVPFRIALCPVVVACRESARGWREVGRHQVRWARTIRHCQPWPYAFSLLANPTLWPLLWLVAAPGPWSAAGFAVCLTARLAMAASCQRRLTRSGRHRRWLWLAPVKDLLGVGLWILAFGGGTIEWRGERYRVRRGGRLEPVA